MQSTSIENKKINDDLKITNELEKIVASIFEQHSNESLTTNEMLKFFFLHIDTLGDEGFKNKILVASRNNGLKAARTSLTHKGILRQLPERKKCSVTNRIVNCFIYTGKELSKLEQLFNEKARREGDIERSLKRIKEIEEEIEIERCEFESNLGY